MALMNCPECNHEVSDQAKTCPHCGYKIRKTRKKRSVADITNVKNVKKKIILLLISSLLFGGVFCLYFFFSPKTVTWCCYHHVITASCTESEHCSRCGQTWGNPNGHTWTTATCLLAKQCTVCGAKEGLPKGHTWIAATCTTAKKCSVCGKTEGTELGHYVSNFICIRCNESIVSWKDVPYILDITSLGYTVNSVGGINLVMAFTNKSSLKTINYITIRMEFFNKVNDVIRDEITNKPYVSLTYTGPIKPSASTTKAYWDACFYNSTFGGTCGIQEIQIDYSDGTTLILNDSVASGAVKAWR